MILLTDSLIRAALRDSGPWPPVKSAGVASNRPLLTPSATNANSTLYLWKYKQNCEHFGHSITCIETALVQLLSPGEAEEEAAALPPLLESAPHRSAPDDDDTTHESLLHSSAEQDGISGADDRIDLGFDADAAGKRATFRQQFVAVVKMRVKTYRRSPGLLFNTLGMALVGGLRFTYDGDRADWKSPTVLVTRFDAVGDLDRRLVCLSANEGVRFLSCYQPKHTTVQRNQQNMLNSLCG